MTLALATDAPPFDLPGVDGRNHSLDEYADASVLAVVWSCNHCPYVLAWEGRMSAIQRDYRDRGFRLVADQSVARAYGPERTPEVFLFDSERRLVYHGAIDDSRDEDAVSEHYLRDAIVAALEGGEPATRESPPVGCTVKWKG